MVHLLSIVQIISAILLIVLVLVQKANTDASGALSADGGMNIATQKRGAEKNIFRATILVAVVFAVSLALPIFLK